ncbi:MAG TPA: hypothetical protein VIW93_11005 [Candidatus Acidoferrum sp.]
MLWKVTDSRFNEYAAVIAFTGTPTGVVVVAYHALNDTFPMGTLRAMIADAGWQEDDLLRLGLRE